MVLSRRALQALIALLLFAMVMGKSSGCVGDGEWGVAKQINSVNRTEEKTIQPTSEKMQTVFQVYQKPVLAAFTVYACPQIPG